MSDIEIPSGQQLPLLREELRIERGAPLLSGAPSWMIFDPVRHKYFHLGQEAFELLANWGAGTVGLLRDRIKFEFGREVSDQSLSNLINFLHRSNLTISPVGNPVRAFTEYSERVRSSFLQNLIHRYLFIRIPLCRPSRFLARTSWITTPFFAPLFWWLIAIIGFLGLYLTSRQIEEFFETFLHFISFEGALFYGASLVLIKTLHELGHAYAAIRKDCRVPTMGVAFIVLWPVLYTDTTDAWKLRDRRSRLIIDGAGVLVELALAAIALFLWAFLDDGPMRSLAFSVATIGLISSLLINLNPFMRFDGYYLFADAIGVQNLQARSFALGRWRMRELLWGQKAPAPELFSIGYRTALVTYAWCTWIYRFFLFLGIAFLVYAMFFKVLGIILFVVEIYWFIIRPILKEVIAWWAIRKDVMKTRRTWITLTVLTVAIGLAVTPWRASLGVPAVIEMANSAPVYSSEPGRIVETIVSNGQPVTEGEVLLTLSNPELEHRRTQTERRIKVLEERVRRGAMDRTWLAEARIAERELLAERQILAALMDEIAGLVIRAPATGVLRDVDTSLKAGLWLPSSAGIGYVVGDGDLQTVGFAPGEALARLDQTKDAVFIPDDPAQPNLHVIVKSIASVATSELSEGYLSSQFGGEIPTDPGENGALKPRGAVYQILGVVAPQSADGFDSDRIKRGVLRLTAKSESLAEGLYRHAAQIFIREFSI